MELSKDKNGTVILLSDSEVTDLTEYLTTASFVETVTSPMPGSQVANKLLSALKTAWSM